jgi:hypothetical protein
MRFGGHFDFDRIARADIAGRDDHAHYASLASHRTNLVAPDDFAEQAGLKPIDLDAWIPQSCDLDDGRGAESEERPHRQIEQRNATRGDVLAELTRLHRESGGQELVVKFGVDEVNLPQIRRIGIPRDTRAMLHCRSSMRVAVYAEPFDQSNRRLVLFAESVRIASRDGNYRCAHYSEDMDRGHASVTRPDGRLFQCAP